MPVVEIRGATRHDELLGDGPARMVCHGGPGWSHPSFVTDEKLLREQGGC